MTTFAHRQYPAARPGRTRLPVAPQKYDIRVVDRFYVYCQAVARTEKHLASTRERSYQATRRTLWVLLVAGGLLCYYLLERVAQATSLY